MIDSDDTKAFCDPIWGDDLLGRKADADTIVRFTTARVAERISRKEIGSYVLNVDGAWGSGKSFFLQRLSKQLERDGHWVVSVNAWEDDHTSDPLVPVVAAIDRLITDKALTSKKISNAWENAKKIGMRVGVISGKHAALGLLRFATGRAVDQLGPALEEITEEVKKAGSDAADKAAEKLLDHYADNALKEFEKAKSSIQQFRTALGQVLNARGSEKPIFVLVDELDRCRPTYAVELLERVKHLFNVDRVIFIFATDTAQLKNSIKSIYGDQFDGSRYLLRFFDRTYRFAEPELEPFVATLFARNQIDAKKLVSPPDDNHARLFVLMMEAYGIEARDAEQCFDVLKDVVSLWDEPLPLHLTYLLPLIMSAQQGDTDLFAALKRWDEGAAQKGLERRRTSKRLTFKKYRDDGIRPIEQEPEQMSVMGMLGAFMTTFRGNLTDAHRERRDGGARGWLDDEFNNEFKARFGGGYPSGKTLLSLATLYPELVRTAGKLNATTIGR